MCRYKGHRALIYPQHQETCLARCIHSRGGLVAGGGFAAAAGFEGGRGTLA